MTNSSGSTRTVSLPSIEVGMTEGSVVEFHVHVGDDVAVGAALFTIEAEKVTIEIESPAAGRVIEILVSSGSVVPVGEPVMTLETGTPTPS